MSTTVLSRGFVAVLATALLTEDRDDLNERLYENKSNLQINSEGTLVYSNTVPFENREDIYLFDLGLKKPQEGGNGFVNDCKFAGIQIDVASPIKPYSEIHYTGSDSQINMLTKEEFLKA